MKLYSRVLKHTEFLQEKHNRSVQNSRYSYYRYDGYFNVAQFKDYAAKVKVEIELFWSGLKETDIFIPMGLYKLYGNNCLRVKKPLIWPVIFVLAYIFVKMLAVPLNEYKKMFIYY